jgi:hypothetical protein
MLDAENISCFLEPGTKLGGIENGKNHDAHAPNV